MVLPQWQWNLVLSNLTKVSPSVRTLFPMHHLLHLKTLKEGASLSSPLSLTSKIPLHLLLLVRLQMWLRQLQRMKTKISHPVSNLTFQSWTTSMKNASSLWTKICLTTPSSILLKVFQLHQLQVNLPKLSSPMQSRMPSLLQFRSTLSIPLCHWLFNKRTSMTTKRAMPLKSRVCLSINRIRSS